MNTDNPASDQKPERHYHWHYVYARRRRRALGISTKQMAWSQVFSLIGSVIAGILLESHKTTLALLAGVFLILPGVFDLNGTLGAALSAKINHHLEDPTAKSSPVFMRAVGFALLVAVTGGLLVAIVGASLAVWLFDGSFWRIFVLAETSIILSAVIGLPLIGGLSLLFRRLKVNPDDVVGPIESSIFDILTVITLTLVVTWLI